MKAKARVIAMYLPQYHPIKRKMIMFGARDSLSGIMWQKHVPCLEGIINPISLPIWVFTTSFTRDT